MMAVNSGNVQLIAECLNGNCNPFLHDGLNRTALDYASGFKDILGTDVRELIQSAMTQWEGQTTEAERMQSQANLNPNVFQDYMDQ